MVFAVIEADIEPRGADAVAEIFLTTTAIADPDIEPRLAERVAV